MKYYEISEETARRSHEMMSMSDYKTGSATAEYRAAVDRAAALVEQHKDDAANTLEFDGGKIFLNMEANRLQILFDEIPDEETRAALKSHGFKWSRKNEAWQRQLTRNAVYDAKRILGITDTKRATAADEGDAAQDAAPPATPEEAPPPELPTAADGQALFPLA